MKKTANDIPFYQQGMGESLEKAIRGAIRLARERGNTTKRAELTFNGTKLTVAHDSSVRDIMAGYNLLRERHGTRRGASGFCTK